NRGPEPAQLTFCPTLWFRNTWSWNSIQDPSRKPLLYLTSPGEIYARHPSLGEFLFSLDGAPEVLFTENETNTKRLWQEGAQNAHCKDAFHDYLIDGRHGAVNLQHQGTKACAAYALTIDSGAQSVLQFRLCRAGSPDLPRNQWSEIFESRIREASEFYVKFSEELGEDARQVQRQAFAGLFWSKQFYQFVIEIWLNGDP